MKINKLAYHLVFWLSAYLFWIFIFRNGTLVLTHAITIQFCYLLFIAVNYYFNAFYAIPFLLNKKKYILFSVCFIAGIAVTAGLRVPVSAWVNVNLFNNPLPADKTQVFYNSFINILFWVVIILAGKMIADKIRAQLYIEQIEKEKSANELNFLRAQFNPHFLFNSINSIYGHIDRSNKGARDMLLTFSDMLRYQLYECNAEKIELQKEIDYIKNYITLQKSRMDERVQVCFCANDIEENVKVAPLIFITFIENAFKYVGFNESKENRVEINLQYVPGKLVFRVFNTKDSFIVTDERSAGLGIINTRRRLELLYPERHLLEIKDSEASYDTTLTLFDV